MFFVYGKNDGFICIGFQTLGILFPKEHQFTYVHVYVYRSYHLTLNQRSEQKLFSNN